MIYLVTTQEELFENELYTIISADQALEMMQSWGVIQVDSETTGRDPHLCDFLCFQFGNKAADTQIVVDCSCVKITDFKDILEAKLLIFQNAKFDLQFLYNYSIVPTKVYDTMIVEQLLYLGYPYITIHPDEYREKNYDFPYKINDDPKSLHYGWYELSFALNALGLKYLGVNIDKTVRGEIVWRGLDSKVIEYAVGDVKYLEDIREGQLKACQKNQCLKGMDLENACVPVMAYLEWCGIKLDEVKWKAKMATDKANLDKAEKALTQYAIKHPKLQKWVTVDLQGDLFSGFNTDPIWTVDWQKKDVLKVVKALGFNTTSVSKQTKQESDSVMEKVLKPQKGIDDKFLELYFNYQGYYKLCSSFGQGHLNAINPVTGRIHTVYKQLGASSSRMSCGSSQSNTDLEKAKKLPKGSCKSPNIQQLPHDANTRACFVAEPHNLFCSCDYAAQEGRMQAEIYNEKVLLDIYNKNLDSHSVNAKIFFKEELADVAVEDVKKLRPDLRQAAKAPFFSLSYGGSYTTLMSSLGISEEEAKAICKNYEEGYKDTMLYAKKGSAFVRQNGYILINPEFGHRLWWWDHKDWLKRQQSFTSEFWEEYRAKYKGTTLPQALEVKRHFQAASKYDRLARNAPSQGSSAIMTKLALVDLFKWILANNMFGKVLLVNVTHDEINCEFPKDLTDFPNILQDIMKKAGGVMCKKVEVPADASVGQYWIH